MAAVPSLIAERLRGLLAEERCYTVPSAFDALSAKLIEQEGFELTFMSGFAVSAARIGAPDTGLISYGEMVAAARDIVGAVSIPVIGDGDTGYGNMLNVRRTVKGYADAGLAAVMIEDQLAPKRCGHTRGKAVVGREEAVDRIRAAADARDEGRDILILARTDARHEHGLSEAIARAAAFHEAGADILFVEAPQSVEEMRRICEELPGPKMANLVEGGATPILANDELADLGFRIAIYPLTLMSAAMRAMTQALDALKVGEAPAGLLDFAELRRRVGFDAYYETEKRYVGARIDPVEAAAGSDAEEIETVNSTTMAAPLTVDEKRARAEKIHWFHTMDLGDGVVTHGIKPADRLAYQADRVFAHPVEGHSVLDVGAWDGYFSFEAKRRGASDVLATDYFCWSGPGHASKRGFDLAKAAIDPTVREKEIDVLDLSEDAVGTFDTVLMLGVFYHLKNPFLAVEKVGALAKRMFVIETHVDLNIPAKPPSMAFYPGRELNNDPTNWWGPNVACVVAMLKACGFPRVTVDAEYGAQKGSRALFHGFRE
ncbi:isocitrate lyase/phosphoenolpyruvate mutase family protein [Acuticoccus mangrovi]|uniref:Isocitrate lyase/phosphoenolpyruvate mutase family protein n=1 Tax=Acuticoccus mangrovi TaxID=2796142 RepID=A0A934IIL0_9HYPH|nr:isocitrate lyase/phosphoenolpyruvate mutase family protein [Acuticoccus mangrovi]MBJ3774377.1 isocitrate lyase/phosphoenolpyruvate mutase family protein [Acuticoccus mangrovi]